ncbi:DUF2505 domain-containing protein [Janibacter sp. G56]|uniref:DUF2505 domain-containing protein n=1 Tax=Janibacter sp. G56 TaxID=3418717 RepID=UPI003CFDD72A
MKISQRLELPATPAVAFATMATPQFQNAKLEATSDPGHTSEVREDGDETVITTSRKLPTNEFPDFLRKIAGDSIIVGEVQRWGAAAADGSRDGTVEIEVKGQPVKLVGTLRLEPTATGSVETVEGDLKCALPLIGGKVEKAAAPSIVRAIELEAETLRAHLV